MKAIEELGISRESFKQFSQEGVGFDSINRNHPQENSFFEFLLYGAKELVNTHNDLVCSILDDKGYDTCAD